MIPNRAFLSLTALTCACCLLTGCRALVDVLPNVSSRPMLLRFGMYVTPDPEQNPIDPPERFTGYHTGLDFEIFPEEKDKDIPVAAVCPGEVLVGSNVEGYGGVVVQTCTILGEPVTVLYGHLSTKSLPTIGTTLEQGQQFAILADPQSADSGENRKHLHLGMHRGKEIIYLGYVQTPEELKDFIDPMTVLW